MSVTVCGLRFLFYFALGFRFSAKIKSCFRNGYSIRFGVFPVSLRKICASTTSSACTSSLISLPLFGFDRSVFRFCGFLLLFVRFCGFLYTRMRHSVTQKDCKILFVRMGLSVIVKSGSTSTYKYKVRFKHGANLNLKNI